MKTIITTIILIAFGLQVHAQPGKPDESFGVNGKLLDTSIWADCEAMALQPDGKILTSGYTSDSNLENSGGFYVARYHPDGNADSSFGRYGKFIIRQIPGVSPVKAQSIAVLPDGKIIACGRFLIGNTHFGHPGLVRLHPDGKVDSSFGTNGFVITTLSEWDDLIGGMVLQPDGKIVVAGKQGRGELSYGDDFLLRYLPNGSLDPEFGESGAVLTSYITNTSLGALALLPDGKILTAGLYGVTTRQWQVVKYNSNGSLDESFATGGFARIIPEQIDRSSLYVYAMAVQDDGKILVGGSAATNDIALVRFNSIGTADTLFGNKKGYNILPINIGGGVIRSIFYSPADKKILAAAHYYYDAEHQVAALRYYYDGIIDSSYGENGAAPGGFSGSKYGTDFTSGVGALQPDGKMIVSGMFLQNDGETYNVALFRFNEGENRRQQLITKIKRWLQHHGISWQTDKNIRSYSVQKSTDGGITYQPVAKVYNNHQPQLNYEDAAAAGSDWYRVVAAGKDGSRNYSNSVLINNEATVSVFPNPVRNNLQVQGLPAGGKTNISISDFSGALRTTAVASSSTYNINTANLKPGNYLLKVQHDNSVTTTTFVKE